MGQSPRHCVCQQILFVLFRLRGILIFAEVWERFKNGGDEYVLRDREERGESGNWQKRDKVDVFEIENRRRNERS